MSQDNKPSAIGHQPSASTREQLNIVIVGHVDHGKSTVIGRLLADTGSLPKGKLEQVREFCKNKSRPFEYAFLLDALKDEQAQGITIDSARCFFKSKKRDYIIIDAPGHIEFLKNMVSGAARADAALLVIDAQEGVRENSKRHGYILSLLGIKEVIVCINKMDLVSYKQDVFDRIQKEYSEFLVKLNITPKLFIPISAIEGENLTKLSKKMPWYKDMSVLEGVDSFQKEKPAFDKPFRMPIQGVYKFTEQGDDRRIFAGRVVSGHISVGDEIIFLPSGKKTKIKTIEAFNAPAQTEVFPGQSTGFTVATEIYIKPGDVLCKQGEKLPIVGSAFKANIFWMGHSPMTPGKRYKLKIGTFTAPVWIEEIVTVLDASNLNSLKKNQVDRHDVAECILHSAKPIAFDLVEEISDTARFVLVDDYEIAGGGIIIKAVDIKREVHENLDKLDYMPVFLDMRGKNALVIGGGQTALQKVEMLRGFNVHIIVAAEKISEELRQIDGIELKEKSYEESDLASADIVYACTNDKKLNEKIKEQSARHKLMVNVVDDKSLCDFITPAITISNNMVVAVSSGGEDIKKAVLWRDMIKEFVEHDLSTNI